MGIQHFIQNKWTQALVLVLLLSSCGGMSHSVTTESTVTTFGTTTIDASGTVELINGIPVPPEPDSVANNTTLSGIDINGNGVRDDVERIIATKIKNIQNFEKIIAYAKAEEKIITSPTPSNRVDALKLVSESYCTIGLIGEIERDIITDNVIANTNARKENLNKFNYVVGSYFSEEVACNWNSY